MILGVWFNAWTCTGSVWSVSGRSFWGRIWEFLFFSFTYIQRNLLDKKVHKCVVCHGILILHGLLADDLDLVGLILSVSRWVTYATVKDAVG